MDKTAKKGKGPGPARAKRAREAGEQEGVRIGRRNILLFAAGLAAIALGFLVLSLGGESLAAILLVGGYLVLVPWAIVARQREGGPAAEKPHGPAAGS
jgi:hypothetical protein